MRILDIPPKSALLLRESMGRVKRGGYINSMSASTPLLRLLAFLIITVMSYN